jgi:hypothetical protein
VTGKKRRSFTQAFKQSVVARMASAESIRGLTAELNVDSRMLYHWRDRVHAKAEAVEQTFHFATKRGPGIRRECRSGSVNFHGGIRHDAVRLSNTILSLMPKSRVDLSQQL